MVKTTPVMVPRAQQEESPQGFARPGPPIAHGPAAMPLVTKPRPPPLCSLTCCTPAARQREVNPNKDESQRRKQRLELLFEAEETTMRTRKGALIITTLGATFILILAVISVNAGEAVAERAPEPWRVSWEERMALRFSAVEQARRAEQEVRRAGTADREAGVTRIDGSTDPEVFVPWELFDQLIATAFSPHPEARAFWRTSYLDRLEEPPPELWSRLERVAGPVLRVQEQQREVAGRRAEGKAPSAFELPDAVTYCRMRAGALEAARQELGQETFDKLLYQAVAHFTTMSARDENPAELAYVQAGCR